MLLSIKTIHKTFCGVGDLPPPLVFPCGQPVLNAHQGYSAKHSVCSNPTIIVHSWVQKSANFILENCNFFAHRSGLFLPGTFMKISRSLY